MTIPSMTRRTALHTLALGVAACATGCADSLYAGPARTIRIAGGEPGGLYLEFAELLAAQIEALVPRLRAEPVATEGSIDNVGLLRAGEVDLALVLSDAAQTPGPPGSLVAVGRVYENYLQLVVQAASPVHSVSELAGRTLSLGAQGSGAELIGDRLLAVTGLSPTAPRDPVTVQHRPLADATAALEGGGIDAMLWSGGVPTPALAALDARKGIRLVPLGDVIPALRATYGPVYEPASVPADAYGPASAVTTIGVANLLVCSPGADPELVGAVTRVLVTRAAHLVPRQALGTQFLDPRSLIVTGDIPLHRGAVAAYRALHG
ncbi:TAXI family TRAP transporter solute-binding subunit [Pseudonocardia spinosispora]|uniref:TAXI family TRAP transporter solute-binding subunit n=1 Tax=Pseudonocardia spinosispora TaxID=103441 RepID=UPI0004147BA4|nr:TAXI family TRAP transporter solute-binding subunit [Pseudonocardia spinosispora]